MAKIRTCEKCGCGFMKTDGCNKVCYFCFVSFSIITCKVKEIATLFGKEFMSYVYRLVFIARSLCCDFLNYLLTK